MKIDSVNFLLKLFEDKNMNEKYQNLKKETEKTISDFKDAQDNEFINFEG